MSVAKCVRFLLLGLASVAATAGAQGSVAIPGTCDTGGNRNADCRMSLTITSTVAAVRRLIVTPGTTFALLPASGMLSPTDYDAGFFDASGSLRVQVQSNAPYRVLMQSNSALLSGSCTSKASSTIRWGTSSTTRVTPLSTTATTIFAGTSFTASDVRDLFFRISIDWLADGPVAAANCTLPVTFSVSTP